MSLFYDIGLLNSFIETTDIVLLPLYTLLFSYARWGSILICLLMCSILGIIWRNFSLVFAGIVLQSFFLADTLVYKRVLRSAPESTQFWMRLALTIPIVVFAIVLKTGGIEPYQGAIIVCIVYVLQARYRTTAIELAKVPELLNRKNQGLDSPIFR